LPSSAISIPSSFWIEVESGTGGGTSDASTRLREAASFSLATLYLVHLVCSKLSGASTLLDDAPLAATGGVTALQSK